MSAGHFGLFSFAFWEKLTALEGGHLEGWLLFPAADFHCGFSILITGSVNKI